MQLNWLLKRKSGDALPVHCLMQCLYESEPALLPCVVACRLSCEIFTRYSCGAAEVQ